MNRSPLAMLRQLGGTVLYLLGALSALKALGLVLVADGIASGITTAIAHDNPLTGAVAMCLIGATMRAVATWATRVVAQRAVLGAKQSIRARLAARLVSEPDGGIGGSTTLGTLGLDELDKYYTIFLPALVTAVTVPLIVGARILLADWVSAVVIVATVPLVPLFMALIGMHTRDRVAAVTDTLARLSDHLVELARGLPVLVGLGRVRAQTEALRRISEDNRRAGVLALRTAFLSSLALELVAMLSVAVVAVLVGVRLVAGEMSLHVGLLALILAPECFAPLREVGSGFHAAQDGVEALRRVHAILAKPQAPRAWSRRSHGRPSVHILSVQGLSVQYRDRAVPAVSEVTFDAHSGEVTLIAGPSGAGKSTVLAAVADTMPAGCTVAGTVTVPSAGALAYSPQHPHVVSESARDELIVYGASNEHARLVLTRVGLGGVADDDPARFSPGELRRLSIARVIVRADAGARLIVFDEPTAHLDDHWAGVVTGEIRRLAEHAAVVVASHDPAVQALAHRTVALAPDRRESPQDDRAEHTLAGAPTGQTSAAWPGARETVAHSPSRQPRPPGMQERPAGGARPLRELVGFVLPAAARFAGAIVLGTLAVGFGTALTGLSGWLIVAASQHPPILYLLIAIVGVRFFGLGRAVLHYCERLLSHDAVFAALTSLRVRLWNGLASHGPANRALLGAGSTLDRLIGDADRVRDLVPRVVLPPIVATAVAVLAGVAVWLIYPPALGLIIALMAVALVAAPLIAAATAYSAGRSAQHTASRTMRLFAAMIAAAHELTANGADRVVLARQAQLDASATHAARRAAFASGVGNALVVFACCVVSALMLLVASSAVATGDLEPGLLAVLVLTPLGLIEPLIECVDAAVQAPSLIRVLTRVSAITSVREPAGSTVAGSSTIEEVRSVRLDQAGFRYPGEPRAAFSGVNALLRRGDWLAVTGASGSGKSTLLAVLLRYLVPTSGSYRLNGLNVEQLSEDSVRARIAWCPQEGHLFDSSLRANLLIARDRSAAPSEAELVAVLEKVGLGNFLAQLPAGLDTRVGAAGGHLSGGQRQRIAVARTLLAESDVVLIDEPTAHLDEDAARALIFDLRSALADTVTVLVTHHASDLAPGDFRVQLNDGSQANLEPREDTVHGEPVLEFTR